MKEKENGVHRNTKIHSRGSNASTGDESEDLMITFADDTIITLYGAYETRSWNLSKAIQAYKRAIDSNSDEWVAAGGGHEVPVFSNGQWRLYVYNPGLSLHGYYDLGSDIVEVEPS